jgi:glycosyltransferase involved in cell wall biosynthesis
MRILYICPDTGIDVLGRKGASVHVREMIAAFTRAGHTVDLVAPRLVKPGADPAPTAAAVHRARVSDAVQEARQGIDTFLAARGIESSLGKDVRRMLYDAELNAELHERYIENPPDLIYVRSSLFSTAGIDLATATQRPLVIEVNSPLAAEQDRYRSGALGDIAARAEGELLRAATLVLVVSEALVEYVMQLGVERQRAVVSPNGVDPTRFRPHEVNASRRRQLNIPIGPVIGFSGGLRAWHGADRLPAIAAGLRDRGMDVSLVIAGDGPERAAIETEAERLDVSDRTVFLGAIDHDDMPDVISSFDVALAPYPPLDHDFYFSPLKLFEYLGCGIPVVATAVGQIASTVHSGVEALLTAPGDDHAIVEACHRLLIDGAFAARIGAAGAQLVHREYTWDHNAERALAVAAQAAS